MKIEVVKIYFFSEYKKIFMVFFSFIESCFSTESIFNINLNFNMGTSNENKEVKKNIFKLVIVKSDVFNYELNLENSRITQFDTQLRFVNNAPELVKTSILPPIYIKKTQIGKTISEVIHNDISTFYKNFVKSVIDHKNSLKLHIILNDIHILIIGIPIVDNRDNIIFCILYEIPYKETENFLDLSDNYDCV